MMVWYYFVLELTGTIKDGRFHQANVDSLINLFDTDIINRART